MNGLITRAVLRRLGVLLVYALVAGFAVSCGGDGGEEEEPTPTLDGTPVPVDTPMSADVLPTSAPIADPMDIDTVTEEATQSVVWLDVTCGPECLLLCSGSGFFIDEEGHIATARHVIEQIGTTCSASARAGFSVADSVAAGRLWEHPTADIAVLQTLYAHSSLPPYEEVVRPTAHFLQRASSSSVQVGDIVYTAGFLYESGLSSRFAVNPGKVTRRGDCGGAPDGLFFDAPSAPGYSGSPLLDSGGRVIGVVVGYCAIPIEYLPNDL